MTKNPDDTKIMSLPNPAPEVPRLTLETASNFLAGCQRLNEIHEAKKGNPENSVEELNIRSELSHFVSSHAVALVQGWLQAAAILAPLQQSLSSIIVPCVARALSERFDNSKGEVEQP